MEINRISGADIMPRGVMDNLTKYSDEVNTLEKKEGQTSVMIREENKGINIDTRA